MKNLIRNIGKGFVIPLVVAGIVGCTSLSHKDLEYSTIAEHIQLYNGVNPMSIGIVLSEESAYVSPLGNTNYFVQGRKKGSEEKKEETAINRTNLLAYFLLKHWNKTGENPLLVLDRFSEDRWIDESEFFNIVNSLEKEGDIFVKGKDGREIEIQYQYYLDSDKL